MTYPRWPTPTQEIGQAMSAPYYHAATQVLTGQVSVIVDPGAWGELNVFKSGKDIDDSSFEM